MKKMFIVALIISAALVACGGKKKPAMAPDPGPGSAEPAGSGSDMGSAAPEAGSGSAM